MSCLCATSKPIQSPSTIGRQPKATWSFQVIQTRRPTIQDTRSNRPMWKGDKYEAVSSDDSYRVYMRLKIRTVGPADYGAYKCVAKNSLGETDGTIKLYGKFRWKVLSTQLIIKQEIFSTGSTGKQLEIPNPHTTHSTSTVRQTTEPAIRHAKKKGITII